MKFYKCKVIDLDRNLLNKIFMKNVFFRLVLLIISLTFITNLSYGQHFTNVWSGNPFQPMNIIIQEATINDVAMEVGDEIAVFDIGEDGSSICVGCLILTEAIIPGSPAIIIAGADDDLTDGISSGYIPNNEIVFKLWDSSESIEISSVTPSYNASFASVYTPLETAVVTLSTCYAFDFNCDCKVDIIDVQMVAYAYGSSVGDDNYNPAYDVNDNGQIDIVDVQTVAYNYGWTCDQ